MGICLIASSYKSFQRHGGLLCYGSDDHSKISIHSLSAFEILNDFKIIQDLNLLHDFKRS